MNPTNDKLEIMNESYVMISAYLAITLLCMNTSPEQANDIGYLIAWILRIKLTSNFLYIAYKIIFKLKLELKKFRNKLKVNLKDVKVRKLR